MIASRISFVCFIKRTTLTFCLSAVACTQAHANDTVPAATQAQTTARPLFSIGAHGFSVNLPDPITMRVNEAGVNRTTGDEIAFADQRQMTRTVPSYFNQTLLDTAFSDMDLTGADFMNAHLKDVVFDNAALQRGRFFNATLVGVRLDGADLQRADLMNARFKDSSLVRANLVYATLNNTHFGNSDLRGANFRNAAINRQTNFGTAIMDGAIWIDGRTCRARSVGRCR